ncbi:flagellar hook-associated protein FlgL [bacterium]|nr:flagellar hook-associated protein FlgL [bacterium]
MRVTHHGLVEQVIANVERRMELIARSQEQIATGRRINRPSNDPAAAGELLKLDSRYMRLDQYSRNIRNGLSHLKMTESGLGRIKDIIIRARSLAVKGANGALDKQDRQAIAGQIEQILQELLSTANQKFGNRYLFGGTETRNPPYQAVDGSNEKLADIIPNFAEPLTVIELLADEGERVKMSFAASDVFDLGDGETLFTILFELRDALNNNSETVTGAAITKLDDALEKLSAVSALLGARVNSIESMLGRITDQQINLNDRINDLGAVDIVEAITRLSENQVSYEMALRMSAKVIQPSLVNFVYL